MPLEFEGTIICRTCSTPRPHTDFYPRGKRRRTDCKFCIRARAQASAAKIETGDERWLRRRGTTLMRKYGITNEQFDAMAEAQGGRCLLCGKEPEGGRKRPNGQEWTGLHVDHDHDTGEVRGLLCLRCNTFLGWAESIGLHRILSYLSRAG